MKIQLVLLSTLIWAQISNATTLDCSGSLNTKRVFTQRVTLNPLTEVILPEISFVRSKIKSMNNHQFEIEVFNPSGPARSYSTATLKSSGDFLKWANWDRDAIIEIACIQR